jgi:hypothetical protein
MISGLSGTDELSDGDGTDAGRAREDGLNAYDECSAFFQSECGITRSELLSSAFANTIVEATKILSTKGLIS